MANTSGLPAYFDPGLELAADEISTLDLTRSRHHVVAAPKMSWPFNPKTDTIKYSFATESDERFEADFTGNVKLKLNDPVSICLKGAELLPRSTLPRSTFMPRILPFKLAFPNGVMIKVGDRVIDTFPVEPPSMSVPSWFTSQPAPQSDPPSPQPSVKSETASSPLGRQVDTLPDDIPQTRGRPLHDYRASTVGPSIIVPPRAVAPVKSLDSLHPAGPKPPAEAKSSNKRPWPSTEEPSASVAHPQPVSRSSVVPDIPKQPNISKDDSPAQNPKKKRRRGGKKSRAEPERDPALDMVAGFQSILVGPFTPLAEVPNKVGGKVSVVAVVRGISVPRLTRNGDWSVSTEIFDPSTTQETAFVANLFLPGPLKDCVPSVKAGDIIILLKIAVVFFSGKARGTGYGDTFQWAGYSPSQNTHFHSTNRTFSDLEHCPFFNPGPEELQYARKLADWWKAVQETKPDGVPTLMSAPKGRSLITLSEAKLDVFFNCIVEILFKNPPTDQAAEVFITDYTVHPQFFSRQPREENKNGKQASITVYGKRVLKLTLWGATQIEHAVELTVPGYYFIDNLRVKFDSKGYLEGTLQDDRRKIDKLTKDDPILEDLIKRKTEYLSRPPSPDISASRGDFRNGRDPNLHSAGDLLPPPVVPAPRQVQPQRQGPSVTRLRYSNVVQTPIKEILGHTSCPEIFRIRARVAAFEPYDLAKFACGFCTKCKTDFLPGSTACHECGDFEGKHVAYEYRFRLCVEEESAGNGQSHRDSLILDVSGADAEFFLSGVPPSDFHKQHARKLRERLSPIFGNLETYQCDMATGDSTKALVHGQYFDMLVQSHRSATRSEGLVDNKKYKLWGTELLPKSSR